MDRKELIETNPILALGKEIFDRTDGMCVIGPGPGGIGVTVPQGSKISLLLLFEPYPVYDAGILPDGKSEIEVRVAGFGMGIKHELSENTVKALMKEGQDPITRKIASAVLELSGESRKVTRDQYDEAFDVLVDWEMGQEEENLGQPELNGPSM
jgi:hypothetical protein